MGRCAMLMVGNSAGDYHVMVHHLYEYERRGYSPLGGWKYLNAWRAISAFYTE